MLALHSTNLLDYTLLDRLTGNIITGATVTGVIRDPLDELLVVSAPSTTAITFTEVGSTGVYRATLSVAAVADLVYGQIYRVELTSTASGVVTKDVERLVSLER